MTAQNQDDFDIDEVSYREDLADLKERAGEMEDTVPAMVGHFTKVLNVIHTTSGDAAEWRQDVAEGLGDAKQADTYRIEAEAALLAADAAAEKLEDKNIAAPDREALLKEFAGHVETARKGTEQAEYFFEKAADTNTNIPTKFLHD